MPNRPRIMVVDDEPAVLLTYSAILEQQGYAVTALKSAQEAKAALEAQHFDVLLCDLTLERRSSGFEVIDHAVRVDSGTHCILLTGYATDEISREAEQKNVQVVFKPVQIEELLALVATLARKKAS
jgi:CheY-like chemotaxis protein